MKTQTIITPGGEELVILPRADFDALVAAAEEAHDEDADDVKIFDAVRATLASAFDARLPAEVRAATLRGDSSHRNG
jgi:hypothetical protein